VQLPEQQSPLARQPRPAVRHSQLSATQSMRPQQSLPALHVPPASTQQRTGNVTPSRHERPAQHIAAVVQSPAMGEHVHASKSTVKSPQLPVSGTLPFRTMHVLVSLHHPHAKRPAHDPQSVAAAHVSGHPSPVHAQPVQLPVVGPAVVPGTQRLSSRHQPQPG
jgi:hypothetical protein